MAKKVQKKTNKKVPAKAPEPRVKDFLDLIAPTAVKFNTDHYVCGGTYRCTLALRSYPASTEELALLRRLGEKSGVTVHIYNRRTSAAEEDKIIHNAENKNKLDRGSTSSMKQAVTAEANLQDAAHPHGPASGMDGGEAAGARDAGGGGQLRRSVCLRQ